MANDAWGLRRGEITRAWHVPVLSAVRFINAVSRLISVIVACAIGCAARLIMRAVRAGAIRRGRQWQADPERAPVAFGAVHGDGAAVRIHDGLGDRQTEARSRDG